MKFDVIKNFKTLDPLVFTHVMRQMGFAAAACYRSVGEKLVLILETEQDKETDWPAVVPVTLHYTPSGDENIHGGWLKSSAHKPSGNCWKKSVFLYFPEQFLFDEKLIFTVTCSGDKRLKAGELDGVMEVVASRIRGWLVRESDLTHIHENYLKERVAEMDSDIQTLVDHELRTPMSAVSGYLSLLKDMQRPDEAHVQKEYWDIVDLKLLHIIDTMDRLSLAMHGRKKPAGFDRLTGAVNVRDILSEMVKDLVSHAVDHVSEDNAKKISLHMTQAADSDCLIEAEEKMFRWAVWEVLKNAIVYSRSGKVDVAVYMVNDHVVIEIIDDGAGVSAGTEELIFMRFFQEPGNHRSKKGKRGLGLGLYLARQIVQRHMGELLYLRAKNTTVFRFIWPGSQVIRDSEKLGA